MESYFKMSQITTLMVITVYIQMVPGIINDIVLVRVQKGEKVILNCCGSGDSRTWLGPDVNNATKENVPYFLNNKKNRKLNQSKYFVQKNDRNYDLIIFDFQNENTGFYVCRFLNNGGFHETKFNVSLIDMSSSSTTMYPKERKTVLDTSTDWEINATQIIEDNPCTCNSTLNDEYWKYLKISGGVVGGIFVCFICSNVYCYLKRKKSSNVIFEIQREDLFDEIGTTNYNAVNIETLRDNTSDRIGVMDLSGTNIDTHSNKSTTSRYSSTKDSLSRKTEGSDNTYESINLDQNHTPEYGKCEVSTTASTSFYENTLVFPITNQKTKGATDYKTPWLFIYNRIYN